MVLGEPFRAIASLELMAMLLGLMALMPEADGRGKTTATVSFIACTDNQGNSYLLDSMMTITCSVEVVSMELPRLLCEEADALINLVPVFVGCNVVPCELCYDRF